MYNIPTIFNSRSFSNSMENSCNYTPIYKGKRGRELVFSCRPIDLCFTISKVLQRIMKDLMWQAVIPIKPFHNAQHGFCHQRLTLTNLANN